MSSDDEITSPRMRRRVITDKDDATESTPRKSDDKYHTTASRSSERLRKKANRTFKLPTRDDVWKHIPHSTTPNKTMSRCKTRLHVNNLFKERHRYNFDPDISSGDESIQDFIDDDEEEVLEDISDTDSEHKIGYIWWPVIMMEEEPMKTPERTTVPQEATGRLSHIPTLADHETRTHADRGEMAVIRDGECFRPHGYLWPIQK